MPNDSIQNNKSEIWIHEEGFCMVKFKSGSHIEASDIKEITEVEKDILALAHKTGRIQYLVDGQIPYVVVDFREVMGVERNARSAATEVKRDNTVGGVALVINSAIGRVIGNFFINFNRPQFPIRIFEDIEEGYAWLRNLKK